ncbi:glucose 1-dehydrogenase [Candidatus Daviesbacteria bacterium]|nr:glucose 1-dehydrogenase [Candidatus Daviesbacteria bacterium]
MPERGEFDGKVVLVTGASQPDGIGAAIAERFARFGATVAIHGRQQSQPLAEQVLEKIRGLGARAEFFAADLADPNAPEALIKAVKAGEGFGKVDILVNNAGVEVSKPVILLTPEEIDRSFAVNSKAPLLLVKACYRQRVFPKEGASVVNIGSIVGMFFNEGQSAYAGSKAALIAETESLARELGRARIRVNAVLPGFVATGMTKKLTSDPNIRKMTEAVIPAGRLATPEDIAKVVTWLSGQDAEYINGTSIQVHGGMGPAYTGLVAFARAGYRLPDQEGK